MRAISDVLAGGLSGTDKRLAAADHRVCEPIGRAFHHECSQVDSQATSD